MRHYVAAAFGIFKAAVFEENGGDETNLPHSYLFSIEATRAGGIAVSNHPRTSKSLNSVHLFHLAARHRTNKHADDVPVYHRDRLLMTLRGLEAEIQKLSLLSSFRDQMKMKRVSYC